MASAAKFLLDEALNKTDIDTSEVSAFVDSIETQLSEQKSNQLNNNQNNFKENLNNNIHTNSSGVAISSDQLTSNGHHQQSTDENQSFTNNNVKINNNNNCKTDTIYSSCPTIVTGGQQVVAIGGNQQYHIQQDQHQAYHHLQNMPKSNEPIKLVYPISSNQHQTLQSQPIFTMNSSNQTTGNRLTFTNQALPNGTINITTSQPQQIMHTVSTSGIPNATTIKTITTGAGQQQQQQHQQQLQQQQQQQQQQQTQQNQGAPGPQTLVIKNQAVSLSAGLVSSAPGIVTMTKTINQGNQQQNLVGTSAMIPASVQIVGMRPGTPTQNQQKNVTGLSPRVVICGPHMVGTRPASPAITLQPLQPGQSGPALVLKTENGYQLLRVAPPTAAPVSQNMANSGNQTIRLQTVPAQQSISTSATSIIVNSVTSTNATQVLATHTNSSLQHQQQQQQQQHQQQQHQQQPTVASVAPVPALTQATQHQQMQQHQVLQQQQITTTSTSGTTQTTQNAASQGNTKEKCRKFLANLIELSSKEPKTVEKNVRTLIQELIDANVEPEEFCDRLERLLNASPQPCLIGFLKKSLPLLRQSLFAKELVIEGIKPPPQHVVGVIGSTTLSTTQLPKIQAQIRPIGQQTTTIGQTQVRMVTQTGPRPMGQTTITKQTAGGVRIQGPLPASIGISNTGPRLMNAQIRPVGMTSAASALVQTSNIQSPPALQPVTGAQTAYTVSQNVVQIRTSAAVNRSPATVQIRATAPIVRPTTPSAKTGPSSITQVKVGQTQIKQISGPNVMSSNATVSVPVNSNLITVNSNNSTATNASTNKVVTIKAQSAQQPTNKSAAKDKEKKAASTAASQFFQQSSISMSSSMYGDDDINDVAAMGGVNLAEESQRILGSTEMIGTQIRSCKDEVFLHLPALQSRIRAIVAEKGLEEPNQEVSVLISHACQERLKNIVERLAVIAEHRIDIIKLDPRYEITKDVRGQIKFLEELDKAEQKRHEEQEREMLLRAAKSRSKTEDPEQAKLKAKAKEMQRAEMEELRQRDANMTALQAIGPRKKPKLDGDATTSTTQTGTTGIGSTGVSAAPLRPRIKRVNLRDMLFFMEQERETCRSTTLYKAYLK